MGRFRTAALGIILSLGISISDYVPLRAETPVGNPDSPEVIALKWRCMQALTAYRKGEYVKAEKLLDNVLEEEKDFHTAHLVYAQMLMVWGLEKKNEKDFKTADSMYIRGIEHYKVCLKYEPDSVSYNVNTGRLLARRAAIHLNKGLLRQAKPYLEKGIGDKKYGGVSKEWLDHIQKVMAH
jgi:tetratricopeptide (TPR) repeat protein